MNYYNNFSPNGFNNYTNQQKVSNQTTGFDINQFNQLAATLNDESLNKLIYLAQRNGISNNDIQKGLNYIQSLKL